MTVQSDIKKAVASAESAKGAYAMAAEATQDQTAKQKYEEMKVDMDKHIMYLNNRLNYLNSNNTLNQQEQQQQNQIQLDQMQRD